MKGSLWHRLDTLARNISPVGLSLLLVMLAMLPLNIGGLSHLVPTVAMIAVFFWTIHRPDLMPAWAVFLIGLFQDLLGLAPLGVGILGLLLIHVLVTSQHRVLQAGSLLIHWLGFAVAAGLATTLMWLATAALNGRLIDPSPALFQLFVTIALYPCIAWVFAQAQRAFLRRVPAR